MMLSNSYTNVDSAEELTLLAAQQGVSLFVDNGKLRFAVSKGHKVDEQLLEALKSNKILLTDYLTKMTAESDGADVEIKKVEVRPTHIPVSSIQRRFWFSDRLHANSSNQLPSIWKLTTDIDRDILECAIKVVIERHEILRTIYYEHNGEVYQKVMPSENWSLWQKNIFSSQWNDFIKSQLEPTFDLSKDYPIKAILISVEETRDTFLLLVFHHIAFDGWSANLFSNELKEVCQSLLEQRDVALPTLALQYADFSLWQHENLKRPMLELSVKYWQQKLSDIAVLELPTDFKRPLCQSHNGKVVQFLIGDNIAQEVEQLARNKGTTVFSVLLTALKILLAKYTGQDDICIGSPLADRSHPELAPMIGPFLNMLVLRSQFNEGATFDDVLTTVQQTVQEAIVHQAVPFETIIEAVVDERDLSRTPLFQVTFTYHSHLDAADIQNEANSTFWEPVSTEITTAQFDVSFHMVRTIEGFGLAIHYCTDLFTEATICRWEKSFEQLLAEIVVEPKLSIARLCLPKGVEREVLLNTFNNTTEPYPSQHSVIQLFENQVIAVPESIALIFENQNLTYHEINQHANRLAHYLFELGVRKGARIGLCMERSVELLVGMLAILKVGAAFVPLDPNQPSNRIAFMLQDASVDCVLTQMVYDRQSMTYTSLITDTGHVKVIILDLLELSGYGTSNLEIASSADDEMSIMYTSGSTGMPKGVRVHNRPVVRLVYNSSFDFLGRNTVFYQYAPIAFDASTIEIWGALLNGGTVAMANAGQRSLETIAAELKSMQVNTLWLTAGLFHSAVEEYPQLFESLQYVISGGDTIATESIRKLLRMYKGLTFINGYGPTEAVTFAAVRRIDDIEMLLSDKNIIGRPIANTKLYITDRYRNLVHEGAVGEILVGGDAVALGYLNPDSLQSNGFIQDPFSPSVTARVYCTGDMGRWLPDGSIEFLGRRDNQLKIRGFRIETAEIENVLLQLPIIRQCLVQPYVTAKGVKQLVAYLVLDGDYTEASVRSFLEHRLPSYMIPAIFIQLQQFPLTPNGKINKKMLPQPEESSSFSGTLELPTTNMEKQIAAIWSEVLGREKIGRFENFFGIGGDSILSIKVISRLNKSLSCDISVASFFQLPTIAELADLISKGSKEADNRNRSKIGAHLAELRSKILEQLPNPEDIEDVFPMSDIQKGMVFASEMTPEKGVYHDQMLFPMPVANLNTFVKALSLIVAKHGVLRTSYVRNKYDEDVQFVYNDSFIPWQYYDLTSCSKEESNAQISAYMNEGLNKPLLSDKRLWRATGFQVQPSLLILLFEFHHSMLDGWSFASLVTEWYNIYLALEDNPRYSPLPLKATYKDGVMESLIEKENEETIAFWKEELNGYKRIDIFDSKDANEKYIATFSNEVLHKATTVANERRVQIKSLFFAAYLYTINALGYSKDITVGVVTNIRPLQEDGEKVLGCFLNTIPFRYQLPQNITWHEFLLQVDKKLTGLKGKDRLSLPTLAKITGEQSLNGNPFFDVLFNFVDFHVYNEIAIEDNTIAREHLPELSSHEATNTFFDVSVSTTVGELSVYFLLRKKLLSTIGLETISILYENILFKLMDCPAEVINKHTILPAAMQRRLLYEIGQGKVSAIHNESIPDLFRLRAQNQAAQIAIIHRESVLSYRELDELSDKLAAFLIAKNLPQEQPIAVVVPKSPEAIIAILSILKAGFAYLPIDTALPLERVEYILHDANASFVIVSALQKDSIANLSDRPFFVIETLKKLDHTEAQQSHVVNVLPDSAAYIIYTSGSTGLPKGVVIRHKSVVNMATDHGKRFAFVPQDRVLQFASLAFDASVLEIFTTLLSGATLLLADSELMDSTDTFCNYLNTNQCSVMIVTAAHLKVLDVGKLNFLRLIVTGGEAPDVQTTMQVIEFGRYFNSYGPTECTVSVTSYEVKPEDGNSKEIPIGKPNDNFTIYLIDELGQLVPDSVEGEIAVTGAGLATGYLNRPSLTEEKFTTVFFKGEPERVYRTGDMGRWLPDGNLVFSGRKDEQIKVRGFRVEPAEITYVLQTIPAVKESVVLPLMNADGTYRLVAFLVPGEHYSQPEVLSRLSKALPTYLVPSLYEMDAIPITANGKVDKHKLAALAIEKPVLYMAPSGEVELWLADLWTILIGKERISIQDNFFELGGHSLLVAKMTTAIKERYGVDIGLKQVFQLKTLVNIARHLEQQIVSKVNTSIRYREVEI